MNIVNKSLSLRRRKDLPDGINWKFSHEAQTLAGNSNKIGEQNKRLSIINTQKQISNISNNAEIGKISNTEIKKCIRFARLYPTPLI